ncbi:MAG: DNA/RNA non-specific endonuclease [Bryobacteraceae bacterium]
MRTALIAFFLVESLAAQPDRFGLPACAAEDQELSPRSEFVLCHSSSTKTALWTAHEIKPENLASRPAARRRHFRRDHALRMSGATDADYRNSGWVRGHLVPAADVAWNEQSFADSFLLSNAVPQDGSLNSGKWRVLEDSIRRLASASDFVVVFSGPIFCQSIGRIGASGVAIPCELYKVAIAGRASELRAYAVILPNGGNPAESIDRFAVSVAEVERRTGLDFISALPRPLQSELERRAEPIPGIE